jgi:hypothetical protein
LSPNGVLVKNVGGDVFQPYRYNVDDTHATFLDGVRIDYDYISAGLHIEPWREIFFDLIYTFNREKNLSTGTTNNLSYMVLKLSMEY